MALQLGPGHMADGITRSRLRADPHPPKGRHCLRRVVKTTNNGVTVQQQFEEGSDRSLPIGDVSVAPSNREIVYVAPAKQIRALVS